MSYVFVSLRVAFVGELVENFLVVNGVPGYYRICKEVETQGLISLIFRISFFHLAFSGEEQEAPQGVQVLALVELPTNAFSEVLALCIAE